VNPSKKPEQPSADATEAAKPRARKPYQKPGFAREQLFETMALSCGKQNPNIGQCSAVRKSS
jgi:hypothetical protein